MPSDEAKVSAACCEVHKLGKCDAVFTCCDKCPTFFGAKTAAREARLERARKVVSAGDEAIADYLLECESTNGCRCTLPAGHDGDHHCKHGNWL